MISGGGVPLGGTPLGGIPLEQGIAALGIECPDRLADRLMAYGALLQKWNRVTNLTRVAPEKMVTHHFLDSLAIVPYLRSPETLIDVGTGAGLPGIPLALARPDVAVTLLDGNGKRIRFLEQARISLGLDNVEVVHCRSEDHRGLYEVVTSRAFSSLAQFSRMTAHLLTSGGQALAMKGSIDSAEIEADTAPLVVAQVEPLEVPGMSSTRHLVVLRHP